MMSREWVFEILRLAEEHNLYITFWSDCHFKWRDDKHWELWELNKYVWSIFCDYIYKYYNLIF